MTYLFCNVSFTLYVIAVNVHRTANDTDEADDTTPESLEILKKIALTDHVCTSAAQSFSQKLSYHAGDSLVPKHLLKREQKAKMFSVASSNEADESNDDVKQFLIDVGFPYLRVLIYDQLNSVISF